MDSKLHQAVGGNQVNLTLDTTTGFVCRLDVTGSPLAGSLSSVGTPESVSSGDSPGGFNYR